jgi:hypothetical protein
VVVQDGIEDRDEDDCWNRKTLETHCEGSLSGNNVTRKDDKGRSGAAAAMVEKNLLFA